MRIVTSGLPPGPIQNFANGVNRYLEQLVSVPLTKVATATDLPDAESNDGRQIIIVDVFLVATAIDGDWYDPTGGVL